MIYLYLIYEFFKIGLFSFGGGYATLPFLHHLSDIYGWYSYKELLQMTAVASITPGPVGINVATYSGLKTAGVIGALFATIFEMLPSLIIVIIISKILKKYSENFYIKSVIDSLKPISCALLVSVTISLLKPEINSLKSIILLLFLLLISWKAKKDPLIYIIISAIAGIATINYCG